MNLKTEVETVVTRAKLAFTSTESTLVKVIAAVKLHPLVLTSVAGVAFIAGAFAGHAL